MSLKLDYRLFIIILKFFFIIFNQVTFIIIKGKCNWSRTVIR